MWWNMCLVSFESWELILQFYHVDWRNLMKQSVTVGAQLLWGGHYGCNNGRYGCTIVMSYIEINKAVSQWLLTFNLCVSVTWPLTCAFHIICTHTPEIIDMHRGVCDKAQSRYIEEMHKAVSHIAQFELAPVPEFPGIARYIAAAREIG